MWWFLKSVLGASGVRELIASSAPRWDHRQTQEKAPALGAGSQVGEAHGRGAGADAMWAQDRLSEVARSLVSTSWGKQV